MALEVLSGAVYHDAAKVVAKTANNEGNTVQNTGAANINITEIPAAVKTTGSNQTGQNNGQKENAASDQQIKDAISRTNSKLKVQKTRCEFSYNEDTKRVSIKFLDEDTQEVIKEIPPEETLEMIKKMWELAGILVDERR
jgi:flagellar protein FlaG